MELNYGTDHRYGNELSYCEEGTLVVVSMNLWLRAVLVAQRYSEALLPSALGS